MDKDYRAIYEGIFRATSDPDSLETFKPGFSDQLAEAYSSDEMMRGLTRGALTYAERGLTGARFLREDAKALLAVNFQDMVILPLRLGGRISEGELAEAVRHDMAMLVTNAPASRRGGEISGHGIIDSLSQSWQSLEIARFGLWEDDR